MLPGDPVILLSVVNTRLRDFYPDLEAMCDDLNVSPAEISQKLNALGFRYDRKRNQFIKE